MELSVIKPKTLPENRFAYLKEDACLLHLGSSEILLPTNSGLNYRQPAYIPIKHLFNEYYEEARGLEDDEPRPIVAKPDKDWREMPINVVDVGVFNAIASAGEDLFWHGEVRFFEKEWLIRCAGLTYYLEYRMPKILPWAPNDLEARAEGFFFDYHTTFYIYQLFKGVTKTKPKNLKMVWAGNEERFYLTSEDEPFYIKVRTGHREFQEKAHAPFNSIATAFENLDRGPVQKLDRIAEGKSRGSLFKHLTKCCGDTLNVQDCGTAVLYASDHAKVWITKEK